MYVLYQINLVYSFCNYLTCDDWIIYMILSYFHPVYQKESYIHIIYIEYGSQITHNSLEIKDQNIGGIDNALKCLNIYVGFISLLLYLICINKS